MFGVLVGVGGGGSVGMGLDVLVVEFCCEVLLGMSCGDPATLNEAPCLLDFCFIHTI